MSTTSKDKNSTASTHHLDATNKLVQYVSDAIQVFADYSVYDTVTNKYLVEGKDFNAKDMFRNG